MKSKLITLFQIILLCNLHSYAAYSKPLFVEISTQWCYACKMLKPTIEELKKQYGDEVEFIFLDASNEDTLQSALKIANDYGISDFFNKNKNAFPTVGILNDNKQVEKVIVGANGKKAYENVLDGLLGINNTQIANNDPVPSDAQEIEIAEGRPPETELPTRPNLPNLLDRPNEVISSSRPPELSFWSVGQPIPYYAYFQYLILPKCNGDQIICSSGSNTQIKSKGTDNPVFKPWDPNATRNEKQFNSVVVKKD